MYGNLVVNAWLGIHAGCDMRYNLTGSDGAYVTLKSDGQPGGTHPPFEFFFETEALRQFLEVGGKALAEMDALAGQEEAEGATPPTVVSDPSAEPSV